MSFINPQKGYAEIKSLEEAKELAEHFAFVSYNEDHCTTTYGVSYTVEG